jgi:AraC-like DNA-binding protein
MPHYYSISRTVMGLLTRQDQNSWMSVWLGARGCWWYIALTIDGVLVRSSFAAMAAAAGAAGSQNRRHCRYPTPPGNRCGRVPARYGGRRRPQIASDLGLSDHTFQRRLSDEGTSFIELVDETRRELAHRHLSDPQTSLSEIVYLLGYSDLFRAYLRWFGRSPGEHRTSGALDLADRASRVGA